MELSSVFMVIFLLVLTILLVSAALVGRWMKDHRGQTRCENKTLNNVVSIKDAKNRKYEENIRLFLEAENSLTIDDYEKYTELRDKAIQLAKKNLAS